MLSRDLERECRCCHGTGVVQVRRGKILVTTVPCSCPAAAATAMFDSGKMRGHRAEGVRYGA